MLNDLFDEIVDDFMQKSDEFIDKMHEYEKQKSILSADEKEPVVVMGKVAEVEDIKDEI